MKWGAKEILKEEIYLLYEPHKDLSWSERDTLFPKYFDIRKANDLSELAKLNKEQRMLLDSIKNSFYEDPRLTKQKVDNRNVFYISLTSSSSILLKKSSKERRIPLEEAKGLNFVSLDSVVKMMPDIEFVMGIQSGNGNRIGQDVHLYLVENDLGKEQVKIFKVQPILEEY